MRVKKGECDVIDWMSPYDSSPRVTLDGEWTYEELAGDIDDECMKLAPIYKEKHKNRAVYDQNLYKPQYLAEKIKNESDDLIDIYNKCADAHRNEGIFNINWFDEWIEKQVKTIMNANLVGGRK